MCAQFRKKRFGFNLLEVVIAGFVFSIVSVAFLGVWGLQVRAMEKSRHNLVATLLAEHVIEKVISEGYELTEVTEGEPKKDWLLMETQHRAPDGEWSAVQVRYDWEIAVTQVGGEDDKLKQVMVTVAWEDSTGNQKVVLETYLAGVF